MTEKTELEKIIKAYDGVTLIYPEIELQEEILALIQAEKEALLNKVEEALGASWGGSYDGYHGYKTLPDCEKEGYPHKDCADCILHNLKSELGEKGVIK